jgi:hypothetical protein
MDVSQATIEEARGYRECGTLIRSADKCRLPMTSFGGSDGKERNTTGMPPVPLCDWGARDFSSRPAAG